MHLSKTISGTSLGAALLAMPTLLSAQVYSGGGITAGISAAGGLGLASANPFYVLLNVIRVVLSFMGIVAVATIIIAGIYMIISLGNDEQIEKGKKIIKYTLIGLVVILFSRTMVGLVTSYLYGVAR